MATTLEGYSPETESDSEQVVRQKEDIVLFIGRHNSRYKIRLFDLKNQNLVKGLPKLKFTSYALYETCRKGKFSQTSFKSKNVISTSKLLELLHINLFGLVKIAYANGKKYGLIIVDDYSRWTWVIILKRKYESHSIFTSFCFKVQNEFDSKIVRVKIDHGGEFENKQFEEIFDSNGISHDFSCPRTPQQNGIVEWKNRTLQEIFTDLEITLAGSREKSKNYEDKVFDKDDTTEPTEVPSFLKRKRQRQTVSEVLTPGNKVEPVRTRSTFKQSEETLLGLVSLIEPTSFEEALQDNEWILEMQEELHKFSRNAVWDLVLKSKGTHVIRTKWVFRNKLDKKGENI
ncbi:uncharacterized protein LOC131631802 [Vicia villosa]|uniref:uncharacterized protein LOC131631802 n=1 Tax=Vicia villosa TaxID=3911 RepID=UPI00273BFE0C|nr:uncharacterized protein LOC131631802 [Vicia villosa]